MKKRVKAGVLLATSLAVAMGVGAAAGPAFAGAGAVAEGTSWTVPTGQMTGGNTVTVDGKLYKVITTWANAWALSGPDYVGVSNSGSLNQQGGGGSTAALSNAQKSTLLGIWASSANEVPNAYNWNYFWNLYCADQNYSSDKYADFSVVEVTNGAAASFQEGVYSPFKYRPEVIWTSNSLNANSVATYTKLIREGKYYASGDDYSKGDEGAAADKSQYYINGDENYDPYIVTATNGTALTFINSLYELAGYAEKIEASTAGYNADGAITSKNVTWKTMNNLPRTTRYEASSENALSARECALEDEKLLKGSIYYTLAKIADGTTKMKKVAFLTGTPDTTGDTATIAVFDTVDSIGMGVDNGYAGVAPLAVNQLGNDFDTSKAVNSDPSKGTMTFTVTVDELATCDYVMLTSGGGLMGSAGLTPEQIKAWIADKASSAALKKSAEKIQCATTAPAMMNAHNFTIEKQLFGIYNLCFIYPELFPNMELLAYWYDNIYHLKSDSLKTAMQWGLGNVTLPKEVSLADLGKSYSAKDCNIKFQEGVKYYNSKKDSDSVLKTLQGTTGRYTGATDADYSSCRPTEDLLSWAKSYEGRASQTVKISTSKLTVKAGKSATVKASAKTKKTFKKISGNKSITISTTGKLAVKKGLKKGTYKVKIKVSAAATTKYKSASATKTISVVVK